jgi:haloacetate dehalogenase
MTDEFIHHRISIGETTIDLLVAGEGHPLVLLHGFPETKMAWHKVAPGLAKNFQVILPDLPGYGDSTGPLQDPKHSNYSKRALAELLISAMKQLAIERFALAGHDRGGRVAYRMALDHPEVVTSLVILEVIPTFEIMQRLTYASVLSMENWFFLAQQAPLPETMINAMPDFYLNHILDSWSGDRPGISQDARAEYLRCFRNPKVIAAMCEEYRSSEIDLEYDRNDQLSGKRIACPTLVLWSENGFAASFGDPLALWKKWSNNVRGSSLKCGHFLMEESPERVVIEITKFLQP